MSKSSSRRRPLAFVAAALAIVALIAGAFVVLRSRDSRARPGSKIYQETVSAFYSGLAGLDVEATDRAKVALALATQLAPEEPAAWANQGLLEIRLGDYDSASRDLTKAQQLAPENGEIEELLGLLESRRGQFAEAIAHLRRAVERDPTDLRVRFTLAQEVERQGGPDSEAEAQRLIEEILKLRPDNLAVLFERARLAAKRGDAEALRDSIARLGQVEKAWPSRARDQYRILEESAKANLRQTATRVAFLRNLLQTVPAFRQSFRDVQTPSGTVGEPIRRFLRLTAPVATPSPPDEALAFTVESVPDPSAGRWATLLAVSLTGEGAPAVFAANGHEIRRIDVPGVVLPFPGGPSSVPPSPHGVLALDLNSDARMDFVLTGAGGVRLFQQNEAGAFAEVTSATSLDRSVLDVNAYGAWTADIEMDGDLDIVIGAQVGAPTVLRNNGDGTLGVLHPFEGASEVRDFAWTDLDQDGDPDPVMLDANGGLRVFSNERAGVFRPRPGPERLGKIVAVAIADVNVDGVIDLLAIREDGAIVRITDKEEGRVWEVVEVARPPTAIGGAARLYVADLDNNGSLDLLGSGSAGGWIGLGDGQGGFLSKSVPSGIRVFAVADLTDDGRLDLVGLSDAGRPIRAVSRGSKDYHWQVLRPRAARVFGDGRINSFGVGGEVEVRAGLLVQKQVIGGPIVHFGLGDHPTVDVARIVWPNGTVQAEFEMKANQAVAALQRLKGSCPFLYAFDGTGMRFVTDFIWRSPLGLRINAQTTAGVSRTEDWVKIRSDQIVAKDGQYDLRITAELWETHYFDHVSLMVVDHPAGTEVFVDERFAREQPPLAVHPTGPPRPVYRAWDDKGQDVTDLVRSRDGRYVDTFGRGRYQGVTRDHWIEVELGDDTPRNRPLQLVAHGWIHPTDSSINLAIGQGRHPSPRGLVLEVPTQKGEWVIARPDLGFPAGKNKTILIDLDGVFRPGAPRRFRLRTNLEVFWDSLAIAEKATDTPMKTSRLAPTSAVLRPRGYSLMTQANDSSPELPDYNTLTGTSQRWRDLIGYYTRFGDVRDLLTKVDDRYVIANAGDELALRFPAPPPPPSGWVRDFVMIGDGWNKDGDYNTDFSNTVLPLPSHDQPDYSTPPGDLVDDPVYRRHPEDWREYHTRYITPQTFQRGLRPWEKVEPQHRSEPSP